MGKIFSMIIASGIFLEILMIVYATDYRTCCEESEARFFRTGKIRDFIVFSSKLVQRLGIYSTPIDFTSYSESDKSSSKMIRTWFRIIYYSIKNLILQLHNLNAIK